MTYRQAINTPHSFKTCSTIDKNRMNPKFVVRGIRFGHLITKLKSQDKSWADGFEES